MRLACLAIALLCLLPTAAQGAERQISPDSASYLSADGGWVWWAGKDGQVAGPGSAFTAFSPRSIEFELGTDAERRAVGVYSICRRGGRCTLRERRMATGDERRLFRYRRPNNTDLDADRHGGMLVLARTSAGPRMRTTIEVRRRGKPRIRRGEAGSTSELDAAHRRLGARVFGGDTVLVRVFDIAGRRLRGRTIATDSLFDEDCKCTSESTRLHGLSLDGRYAYWIEQHFRTRGGEPLGGGYPTDATTRIVRADLNAPTQINEAVDLPRQSSDVAVDRGRILYTGGDAPGVYEMADPVWQPIGTGRRNVGAVPPS